MAKTYLPRYNSNSCIVLDNLSSGYIRVYERTPYANSSVNYVDYFINYDYLERTGVQTFSNYNYSVNCVNHNQFSDNVFYRLDFDKSMLIFLILFIFIVLIPYKIMSRVFGRWLSV